MTSPIASPSLPRLPQNFKLLLGSPPQLPLNTLGNGQLPRASLRFDGGTRPAAANTPAGPGYLGRAFAGGNPHIAAALTSVVTAPTTPTTPTTPTYLNGDTVDLPMGQDPSVEGMTCFGTAGTSVAAGVNAGYRLAQLNQGTVHAQHARAVDTLLAPAGKKITADIEAVLPSLQRDQRDGSRATDIYCGAQISEARHLTSVAVDTFCKAKAGRDVYQTALENKSEHRGAQAVRKACLTLTLACASDPAHALNYERVESAIDAYLNADGKKLDAVSGAWGGGGAKELNTLNTALGDLTRAIGLDPMKQEIFTKLAPALADGLERKGHKVAADSLAAALNPQAFGAFAQMADTADGLLEMADTLRQLMDAAPSGPSDQAPPPSSPRAHAPPAAPVASQQPPALQPIINISPVFNNNPSQGNVTVMSAPAADQVAPERHDDMPRTTPQKENTHTLRATHDREQRPDVVEDVVLASLDPVPVPEDRVENDVPLSQAPRMPAAAEDTINKVPTRAASASTNAPPRPGSFQSFPLRSYLDDINPGLRQPSRSAGSPLFTQNRPTERNNIAHGSRVLAQGTSREDGLRNVNAENPLPSIPGNHYSRPARLDGTATPLPAPLQSATSEVGRDTTPILGKEVEGPQDSPQAAPFKETAPSFLYMQAPNQGLRQPSRAAGSPLFTLNLSTERNNMPTGSAALAQGPATENGSRPVVAETHRDTTQINHRGRGAEREGTVQIVPQPTTSTVPRSP